MISSEIASTTGGALSADITRLPPSKLVPSSPLASPRIDPSLGEILEKDSGAGLTKDRTPHCGRGFYSQ